MPILRNVPVNWASVTKPDTTYTPVWTVEVELTQEQANELQDQAKSVHKKGISIKNENGKITYRFKRKVSKADGSDNTSPVVLGPNGEKFTKLIGNGSICDVQYGFAPYDNKFGKGVVSDLKGLRVKVLVPYGEQDGDGLLDDDAPSKKPTRDINEYDEDL